MTEFIKPLEKELFRQKADERWLLDEIEAVADLEFTTKAAGILNPTTHLYSFEGYLSLLQMLVTVLAAGMPPDDALEAVQTGWSVERILEYWRCAQSE